MVDRFREGKQDVGGDVLDRGLREERGRNVGRNRGGQRGAYRHEATRRSRDVEVLVDRVRLQFVIAAGNRRHGFARFRTLDVRDTAARGPGFDRCRRFHHRTEVLMHRQTGGTDDEQQGEGQAERYVDDRFQDKKDTAAYIRMQGTDACTACTALQKLPV